ncbi:heparan sulfate glucosamine 3-O-sulfotransferase 3B1, partial [Octopus bimaculoides]
MDSRSFEEMVFVDNTSRIVDTQWSPVRIGVYAKHLKHWLQYFPLEQMHFVSGERLIENPADEMLKVQQFLGLRPVINHKHFYLKSRKGFPCILKPNRQKGSHPHCLGETKGRIHPMIDPSVIRRLRDFYKPFNIKFYRMVNQD